MLTNRRFAAEVYTGISNGRTRQIGRRRFLTSALISRPWPRMTRMVTPGRSSGSTTKKPARARVTSSRDGVKLPVLNFDQARAGPTVKADGVNAPGHGYDPRKPGGRRSRLSPADPPSAGHHRRRPATFLFIHQLGLEKHP